MHGASCVDNSFSIKLMEKWCLYWVSLTSLRLSEISFRFTDSGQALTLGVWHLHIQEKCALPQAGPLFYHHCPKALDEETTFRQVQSTAVLAGGEETADDFSTVFVPLSLGGVATCSVVKIGLDVWRPCLASTKKKRVYRFIFHCQLWGPLLHIEYSQVLASLGTDETSFLLDVPRPGLHLQFWRTFVLWPSTSHPGSWTENGVKNIHLRSP